MVTQVITCYHCDSGNIVKNGKAPNGKQKYLCHETAPGKAARTPAPTPTRHKGARRSLALTRNAPLSGASRAPSESRATPSRAGSKKAASLPSSLAWTLPPAPSSSEDLVLELDELWSFVGKKANKNAGYGLLWRATPVRWSLMPSATAASELAEGYGRGSPKDTKGYVAIAISGRHIGRSSPRSAMRR